MVRMLAAKTRGAPVNSSHLSLTVVRLGPPVSWLPVAVAPAFAGTARLPTLQLQRFPEHSAKQVL